jgi:hypothetical protein
MAAVHFLYRQFSLDWHIALISRIVMTKKPKKAFKQRPKTMIEQQKHADLSRSSDVNARITYYLCPFDELFPEQAANEYRTLRVLDQQGALVDDYTLAEYVCSNPDCDCRQIALSVVAHSSRQNKALIDVDFRRRVRARLTPDKPQSDFADTLFELIVDNVLSDPAYVKRLKAHYRQLKRAVAKPTPDQKAILLRYQE